MNFALISKIAAAVLGVGLIATTVAVVLPAPDGTESIWIDQPVASSIIASGPTVIAVHASYKHVDSFRFVIRKDGKTVKVLNDTSVTVEKLDKSQGWGTLVTGAVEWASTPGTYTIEPRYIADGTWITGTTISVTVLDAPAPDAPTPTAKPTQQPDEQPTEEPTEAPTTAPTTAPSAPAPQPTTATPEPAQMPTGSIQRVAVLNDSHRSNFTVYGIRPEFVDVDVQVRYRTTGAWSSWASLGCGDLATELWSDPANPSYMCQKTDHVWGWSTNGREAQVRAVITNYDDESLVYTTNVITWTVPPDIG